MQQDQTESPENPEPSEAQHKPAWAYPLLGLLAGWLLCGIPLLFLLFSGLLDSITGMFLMPEQSPTHLPSQSLQLTNTSTPLLLQFPTPTSTPIIARAEMRYSLDLVARGEYAQAIQHLDQIIAAEPLADHAYYLRAKAYVELSRNQRSQSEFLSYTENAFRDIDKAIALESGFGDYYALRHEILSRLAGVETYTVDQAYLYQIAYENLQTAYTLGTSYEYPERSMIVDLILLDRCDEALDQVSVLMDQTPEQDLSMGGLLWIQSEAQACLGHIEEALQTIDRSMFNNQNMEHKLWLKAIYLYEAGRYQESVTILDDLINQKPGYYGYRYYLRALNHLQLGEIDRATEDLAMGAGNTWDHAALYSIALGELALIDENHEDAIYNFQIAEASLSGIFNPLRWESQRQLAKLQSEPLDLVSEIELIGTPFPDVVARPTARPLPTQIPETVGLSYPYNVDHAIQVDLSTGLGAFTLPPDDQYLLTAFSWPLFHFQPVEPIAVKDVKSLVIHLIPADSESGDPPAEIQLWVPGENRVHQIFSPNWGPNVVEQPAIYVLPDGDIYFYLSSGPGEARFKNLTITLVVETQGGQIQTYGPE